MKTYTLADLEKFHPCKKATDFVPADWSGTLLDVLALENVDAGDRIWVVTRFLDDRTNRLFAVWCAREALKLVDKPDPRSVEACNVAERFANGAATVGELEIAFVAAYAAADAAAFYAAAFYAAAAAFYAAFYAAAVAVAVADAVADAAADAAAADAAYAAADAAITIYRSAQITKLREMIQEVGV